MTLVRTAKQVTIALRKAGFPVNCYRGDGYIYFMSDDGREVDSIYAMYLSHFSVERYIEHVAGFYKD